MPIRILIAGHSFIRRLEESRLGFQDIPGTSVTFFSRSGARISDFYSHVSFHNLVIHCDIIILQLGGNDLISYHSNTQGQPHHVWSDINSIIHQLKTINPSMKIIWCQFLPRSFSLAPSSRVRSLTQQEHYNNSVKAVNQLLRRRLRYQHHVQYWKHIGFSVHGLDYLDHDGTHLTRPGMNKYWRSLRGAILRATRRKFLNITSSSFNTLVSFRIYLMQIRRL